MAVWTAPSHVTTGLASADQFNDETVENLIYLKDIVDDLDDLPACRVSIDGSGATVPINTGTAMVFNATDSYDFGGCHVSLSSQVVAPITGLYRGIGYIDWTPNTNGFRWATIRVNGSADVYVDHREGDNDVGPPCEVPFDLYLAAGDYIQLIAYYEISGGTPSSLVVPGASLTFSCYRRI